MRAFSSMIRSGGQRLPPHAGKKDSRSISVEDALKTSNQKTLELARRNEEREEFVYVVSHDLRAPLVNLQGFSSEQARDAAYGEAGIKRLRQIGERAGIRETGHGSHQDGCGRAGLTAARRECGGRAAAEKLCGACCRP